MNVISKILIAVGLATTIVSNLLTFYALHTAISGTRDPDAGARALAGIAWGMASGYLWSRIGLAGCFILSAGIVLFALNLVNGRRRQT